MEWHPVWELKTNIMEARQADTEQKQRWEVAGQCRHICETPTEESLPGGASTLDTSTGRIPGLYIFL